MTANDGILMHLDALHEVASQASGIVTDVSVGIGDAVLEGEVVVQVRTDAGAKANVVSLFSGHVDEIPIETGMYLKRGQQIAVIEGQQAAGGVRLRTPPSKASSSRRACRSTSAFDGEGRRVRVHAGEGHLHLEVTGVRGRHVEALGGPESGRRA